MGPKSETVCEDHVYSGERGENISVGKVSDICRTAL